MHTGPIVQVRCLMVVVEGVVVVFPGIVLCIDVISVEVAVEVDIGEDVLYFLTVVIGNRGERIEEIWVHSLGRWETIPFLLNGIIVSLLLPWSNNEDVKGQGAWVEEKMSLVSHSSEDAQSV